MPLSVRSICSTITSVAFEYYTPRIVHIKSKKVGFINRFLQLVILSYIIGYVIIYQKGYQEFDIVQSVVTTKVKGVVFSNFSQWPDIGARVWDVADYVIPPQENNAVFVMTNVLPTMNQTQSTCPENPKVEGSVCQNDSFCIPGTNLDKGNGPFTGKCVNSTDGGQQVCEVYAWCQVEDARRLSNLTVPILYASQNFTIFIKNNIEFPKFRVKRSNIMDFYGNKKKLSKCRWSPRESQFCPIFRVMDIVEEVKENFTQLAFKGGVIQVIIEWNCNLDLSVDKCLPEYSFRRLDRGDYSVSQGFNFRYADYYAVKENDTFKQYRNLYKATGIIFVMNVQGRAGKFSIIPLLLNFGSGMALLTLTTVACDIIVLHVLKARNYYRDHKYLEVNDQEDFQALQDDSDRGSQSGIKRRYHHSSVEPSYEGQGTDT